MEQQDERVQFRCHARIDHLNASVTADVTHTTCDKNFHEKWQNVPEYGRPFQVIDKGFTGFVSGYYYPQWEFLQDLMIQVDVGQFLAGDVGTQINVSK